MSNDELIKIFVENWTSVYNTILGRDVLITVDSVESRSKGELAGDLADFQSYVSLAYSEVPGEVMVVGLKNKLVSIISNMMIGLDSFKDEITADDKDAFVEAVNQMFSACQVPLKEILDIEMRFKDITFVESGDAVDQIASGDVKLWNVTMELAEVATEKFVLITPENFGAVDKPEEKVEELTMDTGTGLERPTVSTGRAFTEYEGTNIELLMDMELPITVRIGHTEMKLIDIMRLGLGSIIELEKMVDDPVEILANEKLVARGEVVVCDGNYAVKITEVESRADRIKSLA
jgi:flagellar motor switch protein FliN/FliY